MLQPTPFDSAIAARDGAVMFQLWHRGQVEVAGPDAGAFLHNLCTNDIKTLAAGRGCEFFLCTNKARVVAHGFAHRLLPADPPVLWLDVDPNSAAKVVAHLNHFIVSEQVEIADKTSLVRLLHLCGPKAPAILATAFPALPALAPMQHVSEGGIRVGRHDRLGLPGFDLFGSEVDLNQLADRLTAAGAEHADLNAFNILRLEAGVPEDGMDMDADRFVVEVGRIQQAISYNKGCYLGQEPIVMARDRGHANRALLGLKVDGSEPLPAGTKVLHDGQEVGEVTSSVLSPMVGAPIALAYLKRGNQQAGLAVEVGGRRAVVMALPFVPAMK